MTRISSIVVGMILICSLVGCAEPTPSTGAVSSTPANTGSDQSTAPATPSATTTPSANATALTTNGFPPELVQKVEELIRLTTSYNTVAAKITDAETFKQYRDELSNIDQQLSPIVEDVEIGASKLSAAQREAFDREYFEGRAKPQIDAKRAHQRRLISF